jgi:hypothetical protein
MPRSRYGNTEASQFREAVGQAYLPHRKPLRSGAAADSHSNKEETMEPVFLAEFTFLDVIWWMLIVFFWTMVLWMFIGLWADILRRRDHGGWAKAGWITVLIFLPFLGALIYIIARPAQADMYLMEQHVQAGSSSSAEEIARAQQLLQQGVINQAEFEQIKAKALA